MKLDFEQTFELKQIFDEALDESWDSVTIAGMTFFPSQILRECDPIAYRVALADFESDYLESLEN
jgi:hypothetical protein